MAYIYRYHLKNLNLRNNIDLTDFTSKIYDAIELRFEKILKDKFVEKNFFEFKLYEIASNVGLQDFGRTLQSKLKIEDKHYGFIRMKQTLYAIITPIGDYEDEVCIEFIDSQPIDTLPKYNENAKRFFSKTGRTIPDIYNDTRNGIINNYYLDVLVGFAKKRDINKIFKDIEHSYFYVEGYLKYDTIESPYESEGQVEKKVILDTNTDFYSLANNIQNRKIHSRFLMISSNPKKLRKEKVNSIKSNLNMHIPAAKDIEKLRSLDNRVYSIKFRVHNVGQALATSFSYTHYDTPFLYFDYGLPINIDRRNIYKDNIPVNKDTTIILSHLHRDHWYGITRNSDAFKCHWYLPDQEINVQLKHTIAEIIVEKGLVLKIDKQILFNCISLTYKGISKIDPSRVPNTMHETGLTLLIEAPYNFCNQNNIIRILIAGDQDYDYVDRSLLINIDVLVASHHGGNYCWSLQGTVPSASNIKSEVIFSYENAGNNYGDPTKIKDYQNAGWKEHHTNIHGDFSIKLP